MEKFIYACQVIVCIAITILLIQCIRKYVKDIKEYKEKSKDEE